MSSRRLPPTLVAALADAIFASLAGVQDLVDLCASLAKNFDVLSARTLPLKQNVVDICRAAFAQGWAVDLFDAAYSAQPGNAELRRFAGILAALPDDAPTDAEPRVIVDGGPVALHTTAPTAVDKRTLRMIMQESFTNEELDVLCRDLGEQYLTPPLGHGSLSLEELAGSTKQAKIVSMIQHFEHRGLLDVLINAVREQRPGRL